MPAAYPTLIAAISDPGQYLSTNSHTSMHLSLDDEIVAIETELGSAPSAAWATVRERLDFEGTGHVAALPTAAANTNRSVFRTSDRTGHRSNGTSWIQTEGPPLFLETGRVGVNRSPLVPLHVSEDGATGEPVALGSEVFRAARIGGGKHCSASIIGDRAASSSLYLGDQDSVSAGQIKHDHTDNSLRLYSNDLQHMVMAADGATVISRDTTTTGPVLGPSVVLRAFRSAGAAVAEIVSAVASRSELRMGDIDDTTIGMWSYNNVDNTMEGHAGGAKTVAFDVNRAFVYAGAGSNATPLATTALMVIRNFDSGQACGLQLVAGSLVGNYLTMGSSATPNGAQLAYLNNDGSFAIKVDDAGTLKNVFRTISNFTRISTPSYPDAIEIQPLGQIVMPRVYAETTASAANINVAASGFMARSTSRQADKTDVTPLTLTEALNIAQGVQPITYRSALSADPADRVYIGATAEDVAKVDPRMAVFTVDREGRDHWDNPRKRKPEYLYYDRFGLIACQIAADHHTKIGDLADLCLIQQSELQELRDRISALETAA